MSYLSISKCVLDNDFSARVTACFAQEGGNAGTMPSDLIWQVATKTDIEEAYEYALSVENPAPGADETVITDQMILGAVQESTAPVGVPEVAPLQ